MIEVNLGTLNDEGLSGTGALLNVGFIGDTAGSSVISILNPEFRDRDGNVIQVTNTLNGIIIIE